MQAPLILRLLAPEILVAKQRFAIHQKRVHVRPMPTQPAEYRKAVGVYISPIVNSSITKPGHTFQPLDGIASTKHGEAAATFWQCQEVDFVLGHDHSLTLRGIRNELGKRHRGVCDATGEHDGPIEPAEANQ